MGRKEEVYEYCLKRNEKITAMEIIKALYPGKEQPYINTVINELVYEKKLVRIDTRPYTVHVPKDGEIIGPVTDYSRGPMRTGRKHKSENINKPCAEEVETYLKKWEALENYRLQEIALDKLFFIHIRRISKLRIFLLKLLL